MLRDQMIRLVAAGVENLIWLVSTTIITETDFHKVN